MELFQLTAPLTLEEIDALEKLERAATIGPWRFRGDDDSYPHRHMSVGVPRVGMLDNVDSDPQFVAAARNALPALLSMARRLVELESALKHLAHHDELFDLWETDDGYHCETPTDEVSAAHETPEAALLAHAQSVGWTPPKGESE